MPLFQTKTIFAMSNRVAVFSKHVVVLIAFISFAFAANAQQKLTGKILDSKTGSGISGVTVLVKGTHVGTQTAADGSFTINAPAGAKSLVLSAIGYTSQEIPIGKNTEFNVALQNTASTLSDVVVIGYGTARKKDLTGSISTVSAKDFQQGDITTPEQLISGKVPGVSITSNGGAPGSGSVIRIRGGASLNASNDPLIVIDGMPIENASISGIANPLSLINPNDIETFTVLKDASATAIYGSRASNGVILITTKKGRKGKPVINFNTQVSAGEIAKEVSVLSPYQLRQLVTLYGTPSLIAKLGTANTNWQNEIYQTAISNDNNLSISGALKNLPYRLSVGFMNQTGILKTDKLQRTTVGLNLNPSLLDNHLKISLNLKGTYSNSTFANQGAIGSAVSFDPTQPVYDPKSNRFGGYWEWRDPSSISTLMALSPKNPLGLLKEQSDKSTVQRSVGDIVLDYKLHFLPDLHAIVTMGYDASEGYGNRIIPDSAASNYDRFKDPNGVLHGGVNDHYKQTKLNTYLNYDLNYTKDIPSIDSRIEALAGYEYQDYLTTNYFYPDYTTDGTVVSTPTFPFDKPENRLISYLGRLTYTFKNRYILTGSIRRDGSSKFSPANRWGTFPSGAFAWKIKNESFLENVSAISDLKIRVGYGVTGQQDGINDYDYQSFYNLSTTTAEYQFGNNFYQMYRPGGYYLNRKWEQTATTNVGIDYGFLDNRLSGSIDYYYRNTTQLLNNIPQPAGTNFSNQIVANVGSMENKGVEFSVNYEAIHTKDLVWNIAFNATYNQNKITKLTISNDPNYPGAPTGGISGGTGNTIQINSVGHSRNSFYVFKQVYDPKTGKPIDGLFADLNRDGIINQSDLYQYKSPDPKEFFGFSTSVSYKQWSAGLVMRANLGNYMYNNVASSTGTIRNILNPVGFINNASADVLNTYFSGNGTNYYMSDYYVQNASFLRMDNLDVGYNAGKIFGGAANLRITANVQNVFVITKYKGLDPEISSGIDNNFYPRPRTYVLGLNLNF